MSLGSGHGGMESISPMALAHSVHPIKNRSRKKRLSLLIGRCVSSFYVDIHISTHAYILSSFNKWWGTGLLLLLPIVIFLYIVIPFELRIKIL